MVSSKIIYFFSRAFSSSTSSSTTTFEWSMKPITLLMTIFGQPMDIFGRRPSFMLLILGWTILFIDVVINSMSFANILSINIAGLRSGLQGPTNFLNIVIGHLFHVYFMVGIPLSFTIISIFTGRWKNVLCSLETIQFNMYLPEKVHKKLRYYTFFAIILFILDESGWMYQSVNSSYWKDIPYVSHGVAVGLGNLSHVAATCIQTTLFVFIAASVILFEELKHRMEAISDDWNNDYYEGDSTRLRMVLEKWRQCHEMVSLFVERVNRCFGPCLLITLSYSFGVFVKYSCQALTQFQSGDKEKRLNAYLLTLTIVLFRICTIIAVSQFMQLEEDRMSKSVQQICSSGELQLQAQMETIVLQVTLTRPRINAMDLTDFNFLIIPTLFGVTMTYSIVLYQAYHGLSITVIPRF